MAKVKEKSALKQLLKFYKNHIGFYIAFVVILLIKAVISFFSAMLVADIIANMMSQDFHQVFVSASINLTILVASYMLSYLNTYFYKNLENNVRFDIQQSIIASSLNIKMSFYDNFGSGVIVTRLTSDIDHISERFKSLTEKIVNIIRRLSYLVYIFFLNLYIGLFVFVSVVIVSLAYTIRIYFLSKLKPAVKAQREVVNSKIIETVRAVKDIKTLNCDENVLTLVGKAQKEFIKKDNHEYYVGILLCNITDIFVAVSDYLFMGLSIFLMLKTSITATVFYTCYLYKDHTFTLANEFGDFRYKLAESEVCAKRLFAILYPNKDDIDIYGQNYQNNYDGGIVFKDVRFSYVPEVEVLKGISFEIKPKTTVAFVGESGCGKSTITNLIGHLYYKDAGEIYLGKSEIDSLNKQFIRDNIAIVNQFPYLFNLSIRENFQMINKNITDQQILDLCDKVMLTSFVQTLPKGLDSIIGEAGCQLSGGQRQKLCIARALCRNVKIMIFDEATSSLDNTSQSEVMEVIEKLSKNMTIILIAHRLSTITFADRIILIKDGQVVGGSTHKELIKTSEYYKSLYETSNE